MKSAAFKNLFEFSYSMSSHQQSLFLYCLWPLNPCLKAQNAVHTSLRSFTVSTLPHVHIGRFSSDCGRDNNVRFMCPVRSLVRQTCSCRLRSPACCHLSIFTFTSLTFVSKVCRVCCHEVRIVDGTTIFKWAVLIFNMSILGLTTAVSAAELASSLP